jgi:2'-5' RNA ligase
VIYNILSLKTGGGAVKRRLFIGVLVPALKEKSQKIKEEMSRLQVEGKWVEPENLHFTLRFLGEIEEFKVNQIKQSLKLKLKGAKKIPTRYKGLGVFPNGEKPRVLWIGVESEGLAEIKKRVDQALTPFGFIPEKNYTPHVTLLRIKKLRRSTKFKQLLFRLKEELFLEQTETKVALIESKLSSEGPTYTVVEEFKLD